MADLQTLHTQAKKLILTIRTRLERLETAEQSTRSLAPSGLIDELRQQLQQLQRTCGELDAMWRMQSLCESAAKWDVWKRKVEQVAEETDLLRTGFERFTYRHQRQHMEEQHRQELLERRSGGNTTFQNAAADARVTQHVRNSKRVLEEAYDTGVGIIGSMAGQRERLKTTHRKLLDVLNAVGLSDSVLRLVERRHRLDKLMVYGGIAVVVLLVPLFWWWWKAS